MELSAPITIRKLHNVDMWCPRAIVWSLHTSCVDKGALICRGSVYTGADRRSHFRTEAFSVRTMPNAYVA